MLCRPHNHPHVGRDIEAMVCWMNEKPTTRGGRYFVKHTTRSPGACSTSFATGST